MAYKTKIILYDNNSQEMPIGTILRSSGKGDYYEAKEFQFKISASMITDNSNFEKIAHNDE